MQKVEIPYNEITGKLKIKILSIQVNHRKILAEDIVKRFKCHLFEFGLIKKNFFFSDLSVLGNLPYLLELDASHNQIEKLLDFSPPKNLKFVDLSFNNISEMQDLSAHHFLHTLILDSILAPIFIHFILIINSFGLFINTNNMYYHLPNIKIMNQGEPFKINDFNAADNWYINF